MVDPTAQHYSIRRSKRARHARITISPTGKVVVVVPRGLSESFVPGFVSENRAWINKKLYQILESLDPLYDSDAPGCIQLCAVDEQWRVIYTGRKRRAGVDLHRVDEDGRRVLELTDANSSKQQLLRWLSDRARQVLVPWVRTVSSDIGLVANVVTIRGQKTRWGSCTMKKNLSLNRCLLFLPPALVRYLIVHELCHTVHLNHSTAYWQLVKQCEPDFRALDKSLSSATQFVPRWAMPE